MEREYKWKCDAALYNAVRSWAQVHCVSQGVFEMDARYYDTADGLLSAQKAGLRLRVENGESICCLKVGGGVEGAQHMREEYECAASTIDEGLMRLPALGAPEKLCSAAREAGILEICRIRFLRHALLLTDDKMTAELALDCGTFERSGRKFPFCEIELEQKTGDKIAFSAAADRLQTAFSLIAEPESKLSRALSF